jgi:hypothetical protein
MTPLHAARRYRAMAACGMAVVSVGLAACGGGGGIPADAAAQVGSATVTRAEVSHWMGVLAGQYYAEKVGVPVPAGLASPTTCVSDLKALGGARPAAEVATYPEKCQELSRAMTREAIAYLLNGQLVKGEAAEAGVSISPAEVDQYFARVRAERFPSEAELQTYLADRHWTLSDELAMAREEALATKLFEVLQKRNQTTSQKRTLAAIVRKWTAMTNCRPGYIVEQCKQYKPSSASGEQISAAVLIEQIGALRAAH